MKKLLFILTLLSALSIPAEAIDIKLSQLPLGSAASTGPNDSFPYVNSTAGSTQRLKLSDIINLPALSSTYAPVNDPVFTGLVTATGSGLASTDPILKIIPSVATHSSFMEFVNSGSTLAFGLSDNNGNPSSPLAYGGWLTTTTPFYIGVNGHTNETFNADGSITVPSLSASLPVQTNSSKVLVSSAIDLSGSQATGTLASARMPALTGDVTSSAGSVSTALASTISGAHSWSALQTFTANGNSLLVAPSSAFSGYLKFTNGGGDSFVGVENSSGGSIINGSSAYDFVLAPASGKNLDFAFNNGSTGVALKIDSSGNVNVPSLTVSQAVVSDSSKNLTSFPFTSGNTASSLVQRDSSSNFSANIITAALTGTASGNTTYTANNHGTVVSGSGNAMTVIAPDSSTTKVYVSGGASADPVWSLLTNSNLSGSAAITNANLATMASSSTTVGTVKGNISGSSSTPSDIVLTSAATASSGVYRDGSGNFSASTITASITGHSSLDVATSSLGNLTDAGTDGIIVTGGTGAIVGTTSLAQHVADGSHNGYLSSSDWTTFSSNISSVSFNSVGSSPNSAGASASGGVITLQPANGSNPGLITAGTQTLGGNKTFSGTVGASNLSGTNTGDITIGTANGLSLSGQALSLAASSGSTTGALSSTDWNTFNNKQSTISFNSVGSSPNSAGASISSGAITLQPADGTNPGLITAGTQTIGGDKQLNGNVVLAGKLNLSPIANSTTTGSNARLGPATQTNITLTNASLVSIGSANIATTIGGDTYTFTNATGASISIINNYGSAAAGEAIFTPSGADAVIENNGTFVLQYNTTLTAWTMIGAPSFASANTANTGVVRNASGNFSAGTITATLSGNASTVTTNANLTGVITSVGNATSIASQTGTGTKFVVDTSPTLVTPNLGTPTTLVGTNITGTASGLTAGTVTTNANLTGDITSSGNATTAAATQANITTLSKSTGVAVHGTNTNDSAAAGYVGEYVESLTTSSTNVPAANNAYGDFGSISLTGGDWDVTAITDLTLNGATVTFIEMGIGTATGNASTGLVRGVNDLISNDVVNHTGLAIPPYRVSISSGASPTTIYGKLNVGFSVATPQYTGRLSARRVR